MALYIVRGVGVCPRCGFALYKLEMCKRANACVVCAREILGDECRRCSSRRECDIAFMGLQIVRGLERRADVIVDAAKCIFDRSITSLSTIVGGVEALEGVIDVGTVLILGFLSTSSNPAREFPQFFRRVFKHNFVKFVKTTPIVKLVEIADVVGGVCEELGKNCENLVETLEALYNYIVLSAVVFLKKMGYFDVSRWCEENINEPFSPP